MFFFLVRRASSIGKGKVIEISKNKDLVSQIKKYVSGNDYKCNIVKQGGIAHPVTPTIRKVLCLPEVFVAIAYKVIQ